MRGKIFILFFLTTILISKSGICSPVVSGISTNEINIDSDFRGAQILLFGAKSDAGSMIIAVRGPKRNFLVTKKEKLLGIWYNGSRVKFKDTYSFYSLFSNFGNNEFDEEMLYDFELGKNHIKFNSSEKISSRKKNEFQLELVNKLEQSNLYSNHSDKIKDNKNSINFLDETLFKATLDFPKNISRGVYNVEIYLIKDFSLVSFQTIPIYVNQVGISAKISDFAQEESFIYGFVAVGLALLVGWITNYLFSRFIGK